MRDRGPHARDLATKRRRVTGVLLDRVEEQPGQGPLAHGRNRTTKLTGWLVTGVPMARRAPTGKGRLIAGPRPDSVVVTAGAGSAIGSPVTSQPVIIGIRLLP